MLSAHELATLMLIKNSPAPVELDPLDLQALMQRELVHFEPRDPAGMPAAALTHQGHSILDAVSRVR